MAARWHCLRLVLFSKIKVRPRSCWSYPIWRPCRQIGGQAPYDINKEIALDLLSFNCFSFILFRQNNKVNLTKLLNKKLTDEQETKDNCEIALDFCSEMIINDGEFVKKNNNVKRQQEYTTLIIFQITLKDGNQITIKSQKIRREFGNQMTFGSLNPKLMA